MCARFPRSKSSTPLAPAGACLSSCLPHTLRILRAYSAHSQVANVWQRADPPREGSALPPGAFWARLSNWRILCAYFKHTISILGYRSASNGPFEDDLVVARLGVSKAIVCIMICLPIGIQKSLRIRFLRFNRGFHFYAFLIHCAYSFKEFFFSHTWRILGPIKRRFCATVARSRQYNLHGYAYH